MSQNQTQVNVNLVANSEDVGQTTGASSTTESSTRSTLTVTTARISGTGLGERLNHVFREIRPLVEHARRGNNSRLSLPTWLPRPSTTPAEFSAETIINGSNPPPHNSVTHSSTTHINLGPSSQLYVLERIPPAVQRQHSDGAVPLSHSSEPVIERDQTNDNLEQNNVTSDPTNNNNNNIPENQENDSQSEDETQQVLDMRSFLNLLIKYSPFYLILLVKFMYDRREGLLTFLILLITFHHGNLLVRKENGKQVNRSVLALCLELIYTIGSVMVVHLLFGHGILLSNVVMPQGNSEDIDVWNLIWLVCLTDLIVKIITVDLKIIITSMPAVILPYQKRGKVFLFIEAVSQLYRSVLPIHPWLTYLMQSYKGSEKMIGMFLSTAYVIAKLIELLVRLRLFKNATWTLLQSVNLGTKPTGEQLVSAGESCPICHDDYTTPVRLGCSHIFCELCIAAWLDREYTCPLCRAKVTDEPTWRDGSTTNYLQLY